MRVLLITCGTKMLFVAQKIKQEFQSAGTRIEIKVDYEIKTFYFLIEEQE